MFESTAKFDSSLTTNSKELKDYLFESTAKFDSSLTFSFIHFFSLRLRVLLNLILL